MVLPLFGAFSVLAALGQAEHLKCSFTYTQLIGTSGTIGGGPYGIASWDAFAIFDTEEQKIKVVGFLDTKPSMMNLDFDLSGVDAFASERTLKVKKRDESGPVTTLAELFDFENTVWFGDEEKASGDGMVYYRNVSISEDGTWEKLQFDGRYESAWTTNGTITEFSVFAGTKDGTLQFDRERAPGLVFLTSEDNFGFRYKLFTSTDLKTWVRAESELDNWWSAASLDLTGTLIGTGMVRSRDVYFIEQSKMEGSAFFRLEISDLEYHHL